MGLASSQARMLLLTARKSDLEYRAQMISQRKINIAMQTQQLASEYSQATSNRKLTLTYYTDSNSGEVMKQNLTYNNIMAANASGIGDYLVMSSNGKYVVTGSTDDERYESMYNVAYKLASAEGNLEKFATKYELISAYSSKMQTVSAASNTDFFQSALRNGSLYLAKAEQSSYISVNNNTTPVTKYTTGYNIVSWGGLDCINDELNTTDDAAAQAEYESRTLELSNQDKLLDLELNQVQTQHKAIETEYDSVKKVIEKNIDVSYKIFA